MKRPMVDWDVETLSYVEFQFEIEVQPDVKTQEVVEQEVS